jgi:hypothetical protein
MVDLLEEVFPYFWCCVVVNFRCPGLAKSFHR